MTQEQDKREFPREFYWRWWVFTFVAGDKFGGHCYYQNADKTWFVYPTKFGWCAGPEENMLWTCVAHPEDALANYAIVVRWVVEGHADVEMMKAIHADLEHRLGREPPEAT